MYIIDIIGTLTSTYWTFGAVLYFYTHLTKLTGDRRKITIISRDMPHLNNESPPIVTNPLERFAKVNYLVESSTIRNVPSILLPSIVDRLYYLIIYLHLLAPTPPTGDRAALRYCLNLLS